MKPLLLLMVLLAAPLRADQNLPVLDDLFASLDGTLGPLAATAVTEEIWAAWLQHDDAQVRALMDAGMRDMDARRWRDALGRFDAAVELAPDFAEAWNKRATVYYLMGDFAASAADVVQTLRLEPRHFGALAGQGMMHLQEGSSGLALLYFRRALGANPQMDHIRRYVELLSRIRDEKNI